MRSRLVFGALDLHMLDHIGRGRKTREQADKACRHIEPHVDQERGAKAQSQFSLVSLCRSMSAVLRP
ncbi:MAG: hypothetical protein WA725_02275, partial [Pseudolabrys sp.]